MYWGIHFFTTNLTKEKGFCKASFHLRIDGAEKGYKQVVQAFYQKIEYTLHKLQQKQTQLILLPKYVLNDSKKS